MALVRLDLCERHARSASIKRMHYCARIGGWKQPVGSERDHAKTCRRVFEGVCQDAVAVRCEIEVVHRAGKIEVRIRVETLDEAAALMSEVTFDLEVSVEGECRIVPILEPTTELSVQRRIRKVSDVRAHAGDGEPAPRVRS